MGNRGFFGFGGEPIYPQDILVLAPQFRPVNSAFTWSIGVDTAQVFNAQLFQSSPADGQAMQVSVVLASGVYDVSILGIKNNNRGKLDWSLDGANFIVGQDWYNGTAQNNIVQTGTLTVVRGGRRLLRATVNGKNASSSNYYVVITAVWLAHQMQFAEVQG